MSAQPPAIPEAIPETAEPVWSLWIALAFAFLWAVLNLIIPSSSVVLAASLSSPSAADLSEAALQRFVKDITSSPWAPFGETGCFLLAWLMTFGIIEMLFRNFPRPVLGRALGLKAPAPRWSLSAAIPIGIVLQLLATAGSSWLVPADSTPDPSEAMLATVPGFAGTALMLLVVAPIAEEVFFRGFLLPPMLRRFSPSVTILLNATVFMVAHLTINGADVTALYSILMLGMVAAALRLWSGSVFPGIVAHLFFNGTGLGLFWLTR